MTYKVESDPRPQRRNIDDKDLGDSERNKTDRLGSNKIRVMSIVKNCQWKGTSVLTYQRERTDYLLGYLISNKVRIVI